MLANIKRQQKFKIFLNYLTFIIFSILKGINLKKTMT